MKTFTVWRTVISAFTLSVWLSGCAGSKGAARTDAQDNEGGSGAQARSGGSGAPPVVDNVSTRAKLLFEDALKAFEAQKKSGRWDYPTLERKFDAALSADGDLAEAEYNLGVLAERQGKREEAVARYKSALRRKPTLKEASENLAVMAQNAGDTAAAVETYQKILQLYPDDASSRARLAEIYRQNGEHDRAMDFARQALSRDPKSLGAYKVMMRSYIERKQLSMAKLVALRAVRIDEQDPELYFTMGLIHVQENDAAKARLQFKKAVEVRSDYLPAHVVLAQMALESENYVGAEEHLRRILQADGRNAEALLDLGVTYKGLGQYDKAMQTYDQAEKVNPELAAIYFNRGVILHRVKDAPERGLELYRKYLAMVGEASLPADAPVFALIKEAEQLIQAKEEAKGAEAEAQRMEEASQAQQARMKAADDEAKKQPAAQDPEADKLEKALEPARESKPVPKPPPTQAAPPATPSPPSKDEPEDDF